MLIKVSEEMLYVISVESMLGIASVNSEDYWCFSLSVISNFLSLAVLICSGYYNKIA